MVLGVPSGFDARARAATMAAAQAAGFASVRIIDEPTATAWAYHRGGHAGERLAVVFNLGGGTFDLAVVDCWQEPFKVLAHGGDLYLGGDDVDHALATWAADEVLRQHAWDLRSDPETFDRLVLECERAKIRLSFAAQTSVELAEVDPAAPVAAAGLAVEALCDGHVTPELRPHPIARNP